MYKVLKYFKDLEDNNFAYNEGDTYPREGLAVTQNRIKELSSTKNKRGIALIAKLPFTEDTEVKEETKEEPKEEKPKAKRTRKKG